MKSVCIRQSIWLAVHIERAHICAINRIQCNCGAVYEVVDPKDRARDLNLFKCLVCGKELISAKAYKVGDLHLSGAHLQVDAVWSKIKTVGKTGVIPSRRRLAARRMRLP